jgi:hypothetical protein
VRVNDFTMSKKDLYTPQPTLYIYPGAGAYMHVQEHMAQGTQQFTLKGSGGEG